MKRYYEIQHWTEGLPPGRVGYTVRTSVGSDSWTTAPMFTDYAEGEDPGEIAERCVRDQVRAMGAER